MYKYTESGLRNVRLTNGYKWISTPYGKAISIADIEGLHREIGRALTKKQNLSGADLRFLRKELGWSQKMLGRFLGTSEQNISLWERRGRITKAADFLARLLYLEHVNGNIKISEEVKELAELDRTEHELTFEKRKNTWREAA